MRNLTSIHAVKTVPYEEENSDIMKLDNGVVGCLSPIEGIALETLSRKCSPENAIVNIGCFRGKSLTYITTGVKSRFVQSSKKQVYGIDIRIKDILNDIESIKHNTTLLQGSSYDPVIYNQIKEPVEFVFIDGDHSIEGCLKDLEIYWNKLISGGVMMVHDKFGTNGNIHEPGVKEACEIFEKKHFNEFVPDDWNESPVHRVDSSWIVQKR